MVFKCNNQKQAGEDHPYEDNQLKSNQFATNK